MHHLNTVWKVLSAAAAVKDLAIETRTHLFAVGHTVTFYLDIESAEVTLATWDRPQIQVVTQLQAGFGWRFKSDQDAAGVYIAARRRVLVGGLSRAAIVATLPRDAYCILKLENCQLKVEGLSGEFHLPPLNMPPSNALLQLPASVKEKDPL